MTGIRSFLAGTGASGSLLLAAFIAFVSVTAFVAFDGVPFGAEDAGGDTVSIGGPDATATAAAAAAAGAPAAVAATPAAPAAGTPGAPGAGGGAAGAPAGGGAGDAGGGGGAAPGEPGIGPPTQTDVETLAPTPVGGPTNPVDDVVGGLDQTVQDTTGVNPGLGDATKPITGAVDQALEDVTGNDLGGHLEGLLGPKP